MTAELHQSKQDRTVDGFERLCGCRDCGHSYDDVFDSFIEQMRRARRCNVLSYVPDPELGGEG